ncbi:hypothetical protein QWZ10_06930 [Paracoccus cavernae]|uniref:Uncharacterized protein n=1 Tax=Paracoccus cavernae TaxID=1571207 RepID=A0ABT8D875_9RHOB|nr:hypothetical protein [Paracoccus cavernae]
MPDAFDLVAGSVCRLNLPAPYGAWNEKYEVESIEPTAGINDSDAVTIRLPVVLSEASDAVFAWDAASEERMLRRAHSARPAARSSHRLR